MTLVKKGWSHHY